MTEGSSQPLPPWELGAGGRGFLLLLPSAGVPRLCLWELDAEGRPMHDEAQEALGLDSDAALASLIIEPDGETTVVVHAEA